MRLPAGSYTVGLALSGSCPRVPPFRPPV